MSPPSSEIKSNLPPEVPEAPPAELEMPPAAEVAQPETPVPAAPPPVETASAPSESEIDLGPVAAVENTKIDPKAQQNMAQILVAEPEDTQGLAAWAEKVYPTQST